MKAIGLFVFGLFILMDLNGQQKKIYLAPDDHTDYMWSADEQVYRKAFTDMLDYYIRLNDSTANEPYPYQSKWNCDGSYWIYEYEKNRSREQFSKLIDQIRSGKITVPLNTLPELPGASPLEATIRDMYYAGALERKYGLNLELVIAMEDQVLPMGLSSLWAGAGAKYSWRGVCDCATKVKGLHSRPHEIYWYTGLDDQKILMKWYSLGADNKELGGYAEARDPERSVDVCKQLIDSKKYPYHIAGAFGKGWDDIKTTTGEFLSVAKSGSNKEYQIIVSNETDFFRDFERSYGKILPSESVSYGSTEWGIGLASLAAVSSKVKRSVEKLRTAEGLYTLVTIKDKSFGRDLSSIRERAWIACGLYFDHDWTADSPVISKKQRADWARKIAGELSLYVDSLYDLSLEKLGSLLISPEKDNEAFFVFNPLSWTRSDYCDYPCNGPETIKVVDSESSAEVPFQFISRNTGKFLRIAAKDIPPLGYKIYQIKKSDKRTSFKQAAEVSDGIIENGRYRIAFSREGVITSLIDKNDNNHECIRKDDIYFANDLGYSGDYQSSPLRVENAGPVSVTLTAESYKPLKHVSEITLFGFNDRIEIANFLEQNFGPQPVTYTFAFNLDKPDIHNEEAGSILLARQKSAGGNYADSICRLDWIALNHFASLSDGNNGMTISNRDAIFMKTGNSTIEKLDPVTSRVSILAGGQIDAPWLGIVSQDGDSYFENFFALRPDNNGFNAAASMRFSMEHQNPLTAGKISGSKGNINNAYSLFKISDPDVLVWTLKPAEEGIEKGIIIRLWNMKNSDAEVVLSSGSEIKKCLQTTHIETDVSEITPENGVLKLKIGHNRLQTYRIFLK